MININKNDFYESCEAYAASHPAINPPKKKWFDYLTDERKQKNEQLVLAMISYANGKPEIFDYEYDTYPTIYYNGMRVFRSKTGTIVYEKYDHIVFGNSPSILPVFTVSDNVAYKFNEILGLFGYYIECWSDEHYVVTDGKDNVSMEEYDKFKADTSLDKEIFFGSSTKKGIPQILNDISQMWHDLSYETGDSGSCVIGEGMCFTYCGQKYKMSPSSPWQGEGSWTPHVNYIKSCLEAIGAQNIYFDYGRLD